MENTTKLRTEFTVDERLHMTSMMNTYGGGFVSALAKAILQADPTNASRIYKAFPEYCNCYLNM